MDIVRLHPPLSQMTLHPWEKAGPPAEPEEMVSEGPRGIPDGSQNPNGTVFSLPSH